MSRHLLHCSDCLGPRREGVNLQKIKTTKKSATNLQVQMVQMRQNLNQFWKKTARQDKTAETAKGGSKHTHFDEAKENNEEENDKDSTNMSESWRKSGNKHYASATPDFSSAVREERLK